MSFKVNVQQFDKPLNVDASETLLAAALDQGQAFPFSCASGNCGACKARLLSGEVAMTPYAQYALTQPERDNGLILACCARPKSDCDVAYLEPDGWVQYPVRSLQCKVESLYPCTHDILKVTLRVENGGPFYAAAGQYVKLRFKDLPAREYSMANVPTSNTPNDQLLEFHVRQVEGGLVSHYVNQVMTMIDKVEVEGPFGTAYFRENHDGPIIALAGGSGAAPIKAIVDQALSLGKRQPIYLYCGFRDERDVYLEDHFNQLARRYPNLRFQVVLSQPSGSSFSPRRQGVLADAVAADLGQLNLAGAKAYLAGPPVMVETCTTVLQQLGVALGDCHADAFYTQADKAKLAGSAAAA